LVKETVLEGEPVEEHTEKLPNGYTHNIYIYQTSPNEEMANVKDVVVPADHYYLIGDNRDNAQDSRYLGYIHKKQIKGKVLYRFWSKIFQNVGTKF
jgi:signal peptidase I